MKRLILSVVVVLAIATAVVGCGTSNAVKSPSSGNTELQGTWTVAVPAGTFTFSGNSFTLTVPGVLQQSGTFTLNSAASPKTIDVHITTSSDPQSVGTTLLGIYQLGGTSLKMEMGDAGGARPTVFTENGLNLAKQSSSNISAPTPTLMPMPTPSSGNTELQGTWTETVAVPAGTFIFSGNSFTLTIPGGPQTSGTFTLNSAASPKTIDVHITASSDPQSVGITLLGIYQLSGTSLRIETGDAGGARPASFTGNGFNLAKQSSSNTVEPPSSGNADMQGTWMWNAPANKNITMTYTFSGNNWTMTIIAPSTSIQESGTFTFDSTANPKTLDMYMAACTDPSESNVGKTGLYIYQLSDTNLTLAGGEDVFVRPTSFTVARVFIKQ